LRVGASTIGSTYWKHGHRQFHIDKIKDRLSSAAR